MKNIQRRQFLAVAAASTALPLVGATTLEIQPKNMKNIFVHHVYFWLKNPDSAADRAKLVEGLKTLTKVKTLKNYHIGVPADTSRDVIDGSYAISWLTIFKDKAGEEAYQVDPIHLAFVENYKHLWNKVVVYDSMDV